MRPFHPKWGSHIFIKGYLAQYILYFATTMREIRGFWFLTPAVMVPQACLPCLRQFSTLLRWASISCILKNRFWAKFISGAQSFHKGSGHVLEFLGSTNQEFLVVHNLSPCFSSSLGETKIFSLECSRKGSAVELASYYGKWALPPQLGLLH